MKALLLAAGFGTRLAPLTDTQPKCLVEICAVPLLDYWIYQLLDAGIEHILINTHYLPDAVRKHIQGSPFQDHITLVHEEELLGTAGTIRKNRSFFDNQTFFVAHADNLISCDLKDFIDAHKRRTKNIEITMMSFKTDTPKSCGILLTDANNTLLEFHEKVENPPSDLANAAVYIFEPTLLDYLDLIDEEAPDISLNVIPSYLGKIQVWHNHGYLRDIGTLAALEKANVDVTNNESLLSLNRNIRAS